MSTDQIKYIEKEDKLEISLHVEKTKKSAFVFFVTVGSIIALMPFVIFIITLTENIDLGFGFVFSFIIAALVSFFLYRMAFWNMYGIEKYTIEKESVTFIADYKIFKDNVMKLEGQAIKVGFFDEKHNLEKNQNTAKLIFELNKKQIQSTIDVSINSIDELTTKIEKIL
jgi:hypothetical protein